MVHLLLEAGADVSGRTLAGESALDIAWRTENIELMDAWRAYLDTAEDTMVELPLVIVHACVNDDVQTVASWLDCGVPVDAEWKLPTRPRKDLDMPCPQRASAGLTGTMLKVAALRVRPASGRAPDRAERVDPTEPDSGGVDAAHVALPTREDGRIRRASCSTRAPDTGAAQSRAA